MTTTEVFFDQNNSACYVEITKIIKDKDKEITVDLDYEKDQILENKDSDEAIQEVVTRVDVKLS